MTDDTKPCTRDEALRILGDTRQPADGAERRAASDTQRR
jgi:hypothetical protein